MSPRDSCVARSIRFGGRLARIVHVLAVLAIGLPGCGHAGELTGYALYRAGLGLSKGQTNDPVLREEVLDLGWQSNTGLGWGTAARVRYLREGRLEPTPYEKWSVRKLTLSRETEDWSTTVGKQEVRWGKADGLPLLDLVNPHDTREFVLGDPNRTRIPLWMANIKRYWGDQSVQLIVSPELRGNRLPDAGSRFYVQPDLPPGLNAQVKATDTPAQVPKNWELGLRWHDQIGSLELNGLVYRGWSNQPVLFTHMIAPTTVQVTPTLVRQTWYGASGDIPVGSVLWRFSMLYTPDEYRNFSQSGASPEQRRTGIWRGVLGMDWTPANWMLSTQLFHFQDKGKPADLASPVGNYLSLLVQKYWMQRRLSTRLFSMMGLDAHDSWVTAQVRYKLSGNYELALSVDALSGDTDGFFGRFGKQDRVVAEVKYKL